MLEDTGIATLQMLEMFSRKPKSGKNNGYCCNSSSEDGHTATFGSSIYECMW
jgi:hypothetical protein